MQETMTRRRFGHMALTLIAFAAAPWQAMARSRLSRNQAAFSARQADDAIKELFGDRAFIETDQIELKVPNIAEDGSIVPITVSTHISGVKSISLLVDANPNPLSARFHFLPGSVTEFKTRIKMGESSDVRAVVETADTLFVATKNVKVTLGGCGG